MKMFIGNCTQQVQDFVYRVIGTNKIRQQKIPIGGQQQLSGDLTPPEVEEIVRQHTKYGLVHVSEIDRSRVFVGVCWDDKPIPVSRLRYVIEKNTEVLIAKGAELRKQAAVAATTATENELHSPGALQGMELTIDEVPPAKASLDDKSELFSEAIRVDRNTNPDGSRIEKPVKRRRGVA